MRKCLISMGVLFLAMIMAGNCKAAEQVLSGEVKDGVRIVKVTAMQYKFIPDPIVVNKGEKVRLVVTSADVEHGLSIAELNLSLEIPALKTASVEFTPDKAGTFRVFCSEYCGPGHSMMQGKLIVAGAVNIGNKICPVMGEKIDEKTKVTYEYQGKIYNFCCTACPEEFKKDPEKYIKKVEEEQQESQTSAAEPPTESAGHSGMHHGH